MISLDDDQNLLLAVTDSPKFMWPTTRIECSVINKVVLQA